MVEDTFNGMMGVAEEAGRRHLEQTALDEVDQPHMIYWYSFEWSGQAMLIGPTETWAGFTKRAIGPFVPDFVVIVADSFATDDPEVHQQGQLSKLFAQGHPKVFESMALMASDGERLTIHQKRYRRHGSMIEWLDTSEHSSDRNNMDGWVVDALEASFGCDRDPWAGVSFLSDMRIPAVLHGPGFFGLPTAPGRNETCPCGSGRKSKVCHW
jgi:hypothetical protein